ncbi:hypothetical protein BDY17DRAFT_302095 [Neohortaea acidophila]|uniref:Protein kinase domain-containing protein n=1 Tax=Neohortaea acidophila TaxID=245834 RepID=A0A6A6PKN1_9PEZI|nr:uncharacterized protein BDY17DRAFT_302095 [Neohortaea acidophila]KAF2480620.1 hypothetical protein BDY17DRAFT_302095 [Neohortaea acidophila]
MRTTPSHFMPPIRTQAEYEQAEHRSKLANSYQALLNEFSSADLHTVGNYSLKRLVGKGSFGKVYLASHNLTNGSKVVLKSTKKEDGNLAREIHHHRQFLHPHIARLYEVIVTEHKVWLVLEYCPGDELYHHLLEHGRMEEKKAQKIFTQLVGAVSYVHSKSCVHRDLKLENILLDKGENVKLVDFGFTREYEGSTSYLQTWCGTVCYAAPEMLRGEKYAGEKVDMWSLGVILYALLCGELPYDEDDETATKRRILQEEPNYPDHLTVPAKELIQKLLAKRPLLRPTLADLLKNPWLAEHAPAQQEILKIQQPAPFSTQLEKDTLQRMRSAGVDIDMVIENVLSQRCDSLAGWWALLIEKEQRKEKRRERKRKAREADAKSIRRLSAASGRLLALGEIREGEERALGGSPRGRGRRATRPNGSEVYSTELPKVTERKTPTPEPDARVSQTRNESRSTSRPPPPPKDYSAVPPRKPALTSRGSGTVVKNVTIDPNLLSPHYVPQPSRKRLNAFQQPLREPLAWVKHWFKDGAQKRGKSTNEGVNKNDLPAAHPGSNAQQDGKTTEAIRDLRRTSTAPIDMQQHRKEGIAARPELQTRSTLPARPRVSTASSHDSRTSAQRKRSSLSPHTLTPHSSIRRPSAGLRGRKSTSSSVSSIRSTFHTQHQHTHSKASSTSSNSVASPSGVSSASGSRLARSPHSSVKVLPTTPNASSSLPSGVRVSRRPPPSSLGTLPTFAEGRHAFQSGGGLTLPPGSPALPVFARRKRSVFKGPTTTSGSAGSPSMSRSKNASSTSARRKSGEPTLEGVEEDDEEEEDVEEDDEVDEGEVFGGTGELATPDELATDTEPISPMSPLAGEHEGSGMPLTAEALAQMQAEEEKRKGEHDGL